MKTGVHPVCCMACPSRVRPALRVILRMRKIILRTNGLMRTSTSALVACGNHRVHHMPCLCLSCCNVAWQTGFPCHPAYTGIHLRLRLRLYRYASRYFFNLGAFPGFAGDSAVVLRIEPLRVSPLSGVHPRPGQRLTLQLA